jgi:L-fuconate dehydratase
MYARACQKPLWKLIVDMTPVCMPYCAELFSLFFFSQTRPPDPQEELVKSATFRYITDAMAPDEALAMLKAKEATKNEREAIVRSQG